jgi:hypothetical protein
MEKLIREEYVKVTQEWLDEREKSTRTRLKFLGLLGIVSYLPALWLLLLPHFAPTRPGTRPIQIGLGVFIVIWTTLFNGFQIRQCFRVLSIIKEAKTRGPVR